MKLRAAAISIVVTVAATPAMAQYWNAPGPYADPYRGPRPYYAPGPYGEGISPYEVAAIVRSANLQPISRPWRNGANFMIRATNARGEVVHVLVDAYRGRILRIALADTAPIARVAPDPRGDGAEAEYDENGYLLPPRPVPNAQRPAPERNRTAAVTPVRPPMPRPRPADAPSPAAAVKPAPEAPAAAAPAPAPAAAPTPPAPAAETVPQPTETPASPSFPPVAPLE